MKLVRDALFGVLFITYVTALDSVGFAQEARSPFDSPTIVLDAGAPPFRRCADLDLDGDADGFGWDVAEDGMNYRYRAFLNDGQGVFTSTGTVSGSDPAAASEILGEIGFFDPGPIPDVCLLHGGARIVLLGNGDGTFLALAPATLPAPALALALADVDGDGRDDVIWADDLDLRIQTTLGFQGSVAHAVAGPKTLRVLASDGPEGKDVFLLHGSESIQFFLGSASTGTVPQASFTHGLSSSLFDTGDVDGDGDLDAVLFGMGNANEFRVLRRAGEDGWILEAAASGGPGEFLRDVDGDGDLDGVCCGGGGSPTFPPHNQSSPFEIALNDGTGVFAAAFQLPGIGSTELAAVVDVDGDGDRDLVAGTAVHYANGAIAAPTAPPGSVVPPPVDRREIGDWDGDGDLDVGLALGSAFLNDGAGHFFASAPAVRGRPRGASLSGPGYPGDFDGDGDLDLVVGLRLDLGGRTPSGSSVQRRLLGTALLANDGSGDLRYAGQASQPGVALALDSLEARASFAVDLEGDGDLDLVTRALDPLVSPSVLSCVWVNRGTGFFDAALPLPADRRVELVLDLDLDGVTDAATSEYPPQFGGRTLRIYRGESDGPGEVPTFVQATFNNFGRLIGDIRAGNLHSNALPDSGYPDLFYIGAFSGTQGVLSLNGFDPDLLSWGSGVPSTLSVPPDAHALVGDLNLDGLDDVLLGAYGEHVERCMVGLKSGPSWIAFVPTTQLLPTGELLDLDQDGDLDLLGERVVFNRTLP